VVERPHGLEYRPELVSTREESVLLGVLEAVEFSEVRMHGQTARRTVAHFGYRYEYESWRLVPAQPLPGPLLDLRQRCAPLMEAPPEEIVQALVTRYAPGCNHRMAP
jgi:alkylated DNA repair protein (DNA oxidative demethylase)